ncbi:MAG TPA: NAD-dependent deacylase [Solirubrobacterales bacterium]|nr:NAD-dependent deacylase [Solirubrobacterales bacterium]
MTALSQPEASQIDELAEAIAIARSTVVLTGAGVSVPSGIPDFRTPEKGLWEGVDPMEVAHIDVFRNDPERFWSFYGERFASLGDKRPNGAHRALVDLEEQGLIDAVITQNIDRLHHMAGTKDLIEVHGSIETSECPACGATYELDWVRVQTQLKGIPTCTACDRAPPLKPHVVLFGEMLPEDALSRAFSLAGNADLMIAIGSSLVVHPVASLPGITLRSGGQVAIITNGPTPYDDDAFVKLNGDVEEEMEALLAAAIGKAAR